MQTGYYTHPGKKSYEGYINMKNPRMRKASVYQLSAGESGTQVSVSEIPGLTNLETPDHCDVLILFIPLDDLRAKLT